MIYSALAAVAEEPANLLRRVDLYERLYRRALRATRASRWTLNGDGKRTRPALNVLNCSA